MTTTSSVTRPPSAVAEVAPLVPFYDLAALHAPLQASFGLALSTVLASNQLVLGPECHAFEAEFAAYCGVPHAMGLGNGLDALKLGLLGLGIRRGDEVIVPGQTFVATWLAVTAVGAVPVPVDVLADTGQIDPAAVEAAITPRTAAVIAVHLFGALAPMRQLRALTDRYSLALIEDAAQAHGARLDGLPAGSLGDYAAFSFYPGKNLGALGDGGIGVTADAAVADKVRVLRNYGSRQKYHHEMQGENSRLDEFQAAVLRIKLPLLEGWNDRRRAVAARYREALKNVNGVQVPPMGDGGEPVHHLMAVRVQRREHVLEQLDAAGVQALVHYPVTPGDSAAYHHPDAAAMVNSRRWADEELSLPMGPTMTDDQVDRVVEVLTTATAETLR